MRPDVSSIRAAATTVVSVLSVSMSRIESVRRTVTGWLWIALRVTGRRTRSVTRTTSTRTRRVFDGPVKRAVTGPIRTGLLGRREDLSLLTVLLAPILAAGTAWWVGSTMGYATLEQWVHGTWYGTQPSIVVFLGVAFLVAIGTVSVALNSGFLPTLVLVGAPIFGTAVTRYGNELTYHWGTSVVSLPNAVGVATVYAVGFGFPLAVCSFLLGLAARRILTILDFGSGPSSNPDRV